MSAYKRFKTQMTDLNILISALEEIRPNWEGKMLVDPAGNLSPLGYQGDDRSVSAKAGYHAPKAVVIIPGSGSEIKGRGTNVVGTASNDISISRGEDGKFSIDISQNESRQYNEAFRNELSATYGLASRLKDALTGAGAGNVKILGDKQMVNHPTWGMVPGIPCAVKAKAVLA
jgi:hypothetical protein